MPKNILASVIFFFWWWFFGLIWTIIATVAVVKTRKKQKEWKSGIHRKLAYTCEKSTCTALIVYKYPKYPKTQAIYIIFPAYATFIVFFCLMFVVIYDPQSGIDWPMTHSQIVKYLKYLGEITINQHYFSLPNLII